MGYNTATKNTMLGALGITQASLHSADPGETGANEISGGSPAYARKAITFGAASSGQMVQSGSAVFDVPGGVTVTHVGFWAGSTFRGSDALAASESFGSQGTTTLSGTTLTP